MITVVYKLYDKRDAFPFHIVRMPDASSNIPDHVFYATIYSELLRIARASLHYLDFLVKAKALVQKMQKQGGSLESVKSVNQVNTKEDGTTTVCFKIIHRYLSLSTTVLAVSKFQLT